MGICSTCENSLPVDEKSPVNQRFLPIWGKNGCVFQFPQNGNSENDLPQGIGISEPLIYIFAKGIPFRKSCLTSGERDIFAQKICEE